jgi:hypothetical protein
LPHPDLRPIPTKYQGVEFRSKLEAKWACFFDEMGLRWEYEPEGYELPDGTRYLPDFLIRCGDGDADWVYGEVKPTRAGFEKADALYRASGRIVMCLYGAPGDHPVPSFNLVDWMCVRLGYEPEGLWLRLNGAVLRAKGHRFWNPSRRGGPPVNLIDLAPRDS